jgi:hypothetical protein
MAPMLSRPMSRTAILIAAAAEVAWALFLAYEIHHRMSYAGFSSTLGWDIQLINFIAEWAPPAIAIIVVTWFADGGVAQLRQSTSSV